MNMHFYPALSFNILSQGFGVSGTKYSDSEYLGFGRTVENLSPGGSDVLPFGK